MGQKDRYCGLAEEYYSWKLKEKKISKERDWLILPNATVSSNETKT